MDNEPRVREFVTAGRKRQHALGLPGDKARLDTGGRADLREPGGISSLPPEVEPPGCRVRRCDVGGKDLGLVVSARSQEQQRGVCLVEFLLLIAVEGGKHAVVFHVVSIYDRIGRGKARLTSAVEKEAAGGVITAVKQAVKVVFVVLSLYYGVAQGRAFQDEPGCDVWIYPRQGLEVHLVWLRRLVRGRRLGRGLGGRVGGGQGLDVDV